MGGRRLILHDRTDRIAAMDAAPQRKHHRIPQEECMDNELKDFRGKITTEAWCVIEAEHRTTGDDHSAIVRDVLHVWALTKISQASVLGKLMEAEGIVGNAREPSGKPS